MNCTLRVKCGAGKPKHTSDGEECGAKCVIIMSGALMRLCFGSTWQKHFVLFCLISHEDGQN